MSHRVYTKTIKIEKEVAFTELTCDGCGSHHNRDKNAAINIREEARRISA